MLTVVEQGDRARLRRVKGQVPGLPQVALLASAARWAADFAARVAHHVGMKLHTGGRDDEEPLIVVLAVRRGDVHEADLPGKSRFELGQTVFEVELRADFHTRKDDAFDFYVRVNGRG